MAGMHNRGANFDQNEGFSRPIRAINPLQVGDSLLKAEQDAAPVLPEHRAERS